MIIAITTIAAVAAIVFGVTQKNKLKHTEELLSDKVTANTILRSHMNNVESELKAANDHIKSLRSELQSCTDKAKAAKAKAPGATGGEVSFKDQAPFEDDLPF